MRRNKLLAILASTTLSLLLPATHARAQAAPAQFFWVCYSAGNEANIYVSGVLQGPATAAAAFRVGFVQTLMQRYSYQGNAGCVPARTAINAQDDMNRRMAALRNAKKNVVATGWTEAAPATAPAAASGASGTSGTVASPLAGLIGGSSTPAATAAAATSAAQPAKPQTQAGGNSSGAQGASSTGGSTAASVLATLFGTPAGAGANSGGAAGGANAPAGQPAGKPAAAGGVSGAGGGGGANTGAVTQVTSTLSTLFGSKGSGGAAPGGAGNGARPGAPGANGGGAVPAAATPGPNAPGGPAQGALGSAQFANTMLVVYGCGRQGTSGTQVLCVADLTNQNAKDTLVQSDAVWKDAFIVDDRGDRHMRTNGYFLNIDGEQRQQLDIDNGKSAHFILAFDGIPAKVEKIELRSATGGLSVKGISLIAVGGADASAQAQPAGH